MHHPNIDSGHWAIIQQPGPDVGKYNCFAHAMGRDESKQEQVEAPRDPDEFVKLARERDPNWQKRPDLDYSCTPGVQKIVIYMEPGGAMISHAAIQQPDGSWHSKLARGPIIEHEKPEQLSGYGKVIAVIQRPNPLITCKKGK